MRLNDLIKSRGLTIKSLSQLSGVSTRTIELYTSGRRDIGNARARIVISLADALQVHPRELLDEPSV